MDIVLDLAPALCEPLAAALRALGVSCAAPGQAPAPALVVVSAAPGNLPAPGGPSDDEAPAAFWLAPGPVGYSEAQALDAGADGFAVWGDLALTDLAARVAALARRRARDLDLHPMTRLPGGAALNAALLRALPLRGQAALTGYDIRDFKAFNDRYGFSRGDEVLRFLAEVLRETAGDRGRVYHLGGDDFFVLTRPAECEELAAAALTRFDAGMPGFHDPADLARGYLVGLDRKSGAPRHHPLMCLTAATACNTAEGMTHPGRLAQVIAELKAYARQEPGSRHVRDRRQFHGAAAALARRPGPAGDTGA